jgi:hypothetical protein
MPTRFLSNLRPLLNFNLEFEMERKKDKNKTDIDIHSKNVKSLNFKMWHGGGRGVGRTIYY